MRDSETVRRRTVLGALAGVGLQSITGTGVADDTGNATVRSGQQEQAEPTRVLIEGGEPPASTATGTPRGRLLGPLVPSRWHPVGRQKLLFSSDYAYETESGGWREASGVFRLQEGEISILAREYEVDESEYGDASSPKYSLQSGTVLYDPTVGPGFWLQDANAAGGSVFTYGNDAILFRITNRTPDVVATPAEFDALFRARISPGPDSFVAFTGQRSGSDRRALFRYDGDGVSEVVRNGDETPVGGRFRVFSMYPVADGNLLFQNVTSSANGIFLARPDDTVTDVVIDGDTGPNGDSEFQNIEAIAASDDGRVLFSATLGGSTDLFETTVGTDEVTERSSPANGVGELVSGTLTDRGEFTARNDAGEIHVFGISGSSVQQTDALADIEGVGGAKLAPDGTVYFTREVTIDGSTHRVMFRRVRNAEYGNDIRLAPESDSFQPLQVVWQDDPDANRYDDYEEYMQQDGAFTRTATLDMVKGKQTVLFGHPDETEIELEVVNSFPDERAVAVEFRLFPPTEGERSSPRENTERIHLTDPYEIPGAAGPLNPTRETITIETPIERNVAGENDVDPERISPEPFRFDEKGWYWVEMELVEPDGGLLQDGDPDNQKSGVSVEVIQTEPMNVRLQPFDFPSPVVGGSWASWDRILEAVETGQNPNAPQHDYTLEGFLDGTFPVPEDALRLWRGRAPIQKPITINFDVIESLNEFQGLSKNQQRAFLETLADRFTTNYVLGDNAVTKLVIVLPEGVFEAFSAIIPGTTSDSPLPGWAPPAVPTAVFIPATTATGSNPMNVFSSVAHELGHQYGLWDGGSEEYNPSIPGNNQITDGGRGDGRNANGYWVERAEPRGKPLASTQATCFMGLAGNIDLPQGKWIDQADYVDLLEEFKVNPHVRYDGAVALIRGTIDTADSVTLRPWYTLENHPTDIEAGSQGEYAIVNVGPDGEDRASYGFDLTFGAYHEFEGFVEYDEVSFLKRVPIDEGTQTIQLRSGDEVLAEREIRSQPPSVSITSPAAGEAVTGPTVTVEWDASLSEADGWFALLYQESQTDEWVTVAADLTDQQYEWDVTDLPESDSYAIQVVATDGINTTREVSEPFSLTETESNTGDETESTPGETGDEVESTPESVTDETEATPTASTDGSTLPVPVEAVVAGLGTAALAGYLLKRKLDEQNEP